MSARPPAIECRGLAKSYGEVRALSGLDLLVPSGSIFGLLGPNGAGKTTLLRLLTGLRQATSGSAFIEGQPVGPQTSRRIGYLDGGTVRALEAVARGRVPAAPGAPRTGIGPVMTFRALLEKELVEQWRTMRMPSLLAVFLFIGISSPASAHYLPDLMEAIGGPSFAAAFPAPTILDAHAQLAKNVVQLGAIGVIVISMAAVSSERERGTLAFLLSKPVARSAFLSAKLAALGATIGLGMLIAAVAAYLYTTLLFAPPGLGFLLLCLASALSLLVFATITLAASVVTGSAVAAGGIGLGALVISGVVSMVPNVGVYTPAGAVTRAVEVVGGAAADLLIAPLFAQAAIVSLAFAAAIATFRHQEV